MLSSVALDRAEVMLRTSFPMISGAAMMQNSAICVSSSAPVMQPLPMMSMSGSFQWFGPAYLASTFE